jgi:hypothetical protein
MMRTSLSDDEWDLVVRSHGRAPAIRGSLRMGRPVGVGSGDPGGWFGTRLDDDELAHHAAVLVARTTDHGLQEPLSRAFRSRPHSWRRFPHGVSSTGRLNSVTDRDARDRGLFVELRRIELLTSSMPFIA